MAPEALTASLLTPSPWEQPRHVEPASVAQLCPTFMRYHHDAEFRAALDAETEQRRAEAHAARQVVVKAQWEAVWARDEENNQ